MNDYLKRAQHPVISWAVIISAVGLSGSALYSANDVENLALANASGISHEKELRISKQEEIKEDINDLGKDVEKLGETLKEETKTIKNLLNQLLLRRSDRLPNS